MTLEEALRKHLTCEHTLRVGSEGDATVVYHDDQYVAFRLDPGMEATPERGSMVFHALARQLVPLGEHTLADMTISDDEYASFMAEPASA